MKRILIVILIIITSGIQNLNAQETMIEIQKDQDISIEEIFQLIKTKTDYQFVYPSSILNTSRKIPLEAGATSVKNLLNLSLAVINCEYDYNDNTIIVRKRKEKAKTKTISGRVTYLNEPVEDVNIILKNKRKGTRTNVNGFYEIKASVGEIIKFSHVGFKSFEIIVEDVTEILNIELAESTNELKEAVIIVKKEKELGIADKLNQKVKTSIGDINPMLFPSRVHFYEGKRIKHHHTLERALIWELGFSPQIFDIDGVVYYNADWVPMNRIISVYVVTGSQGTMRWGGPVVIVSTMDSPEEIAKRREAKAEQHRNQNYYVEDSVEKPADDIVTASSQSKHAVQKSIDVYGKITFENQPLSDVNIKILDTPNGTKTDDSGQYNIKTKAGDELRFSYVGLHTVTVIIEDVTAEINIEMVSSTNSLDEVVVTAKTAKGSLIKRSKKADQAVQTSRGVLDPQRATFPVTYLDGDDINPIYRTLAEFVEARIPSARRVKDPNTGEVRMIVKTTVSEVRPDYAIWDVDGQIFEVEPPLDVNNIKSLHVLKTLSATTKYGSVASGGVIVVRTTYGTFDVRESQLSKIAAKYQNNDFYQDDAVAFNLDENNASSYLPLLKQYTNRAYAYRYYEEALQSSIVNFYDHIDIARLFYTHFSDKYKSIRILVYLSKKHANNPEILKAVAYNLQVIGATREAVKIYESIYKLRTDYAQSYRDLANAYKENNKFKKAWRMYMSYLMQGHNADGEGIGQTVYNEMEYLYFARPNQTQIKERFQPKSEDLFDFRNDVRFLIEWHTSEAEFDLEFVGPDRRAYVFEHSLVANQELISDEKRRGYSSKEFFIDDIGNDEWLINLTYKGNKRDIPTYFKVTTYYHWGKANQRADVQVYKFQDQRIKVSLVKINKQSLLTSK